MRYYIDCIIANNFTGWWETQGRVAMRNAFRFAERVFCFYVWRHGIVAASAEAA